MRKVLLISQSQDGSYVNILNEALGRCGYSLSVLTGKNSNISPDVAVIQSVKYDSNTFNSRFKTWYHFVRNAKKYLKRNFKAFDLVLFTSNPPINQALVKFVQKKKIKTAYMIWDIYPDCVEKSFGRRVKPITAVWRKINGKIYDNCDLILTIGSGMRDNLRKSYSKTIEVISYHTDTEFIKPIKPEDNIFLKKYDISSKTVFMYSGKMGFGHGFNEILSVAENLKERNDICFVLIGFGSAYKDVETYVREKKLENVLVLPYQPLDMLPYSLGAADAAFVTIKSDTDGLFLPSKVYDAMSSGSAIICISEGHNDIAYLVERENVGINVKTGSVELLQAAVLTMADDKAQLNAYQKNAREIAVECYDSRKIISLYEKVFQRILEDKE